MAAETEQSTPAEGQKPKRRRHILTRLFFWLFCLVLFCGLAACGVAASLLYWASRDLPNITRISDYNPPQATTVLARDGQILGTLYHEKRYVIPLSDMAHYLPMCFLAAEDDSFYHHLGVDPWAILRAAINNFRRGHTGEGGSTITQQLVKQLLLTSERSYTRKMKEAILAYQIEKDLTKNEILTIYLNQIYLGEHAYGVEAAARTYFGKHAADITLAESAVIAGLPKAPSKYNPFRAPEAAKERQMYVLGRLRDLNWITNQEYSQAINEPLVYWSMPDAMGGAAQWYMEEARRLLIEFFTEDNLKALGVDTPLSGEDYVYEAGLTVQTCMEPAQQEAGAKALRRGLQELDKRQGWRGPIARQDKLVLDAFAGGHKFAPENLIGRNWVQALVLSVTPQAVTVDLGNGYQGVIPPGNMAWARRQNGKSVVQKGDLIWVSLPWESDDYDPAKVRKDMPITLRLQQEPEIQGALASLEPQSGDVVALIGGYNFGDSHFNRATQAKRQPGSSFKPVVYSAALDNGFTPFSTVSDAPFVYVNPYTHEVWRPSNYEHNYKGDLPLWQALALSRNTCTARLAQAVGVDTVIERAKALGFESDFPHALAISLGAVEVSPLNLTQAYAAFANNGLGVRPRIITSITDAQGRQLYAQAAEHWQALSPENAYMMACLLKNVVNHGTGRGAQIEGRFIAGKTGTTNDEHDAWFVGFTPYLVTGVWVGYDQLRSIGHREQGGRTAAPIFKYYRTDVEPLYQAEDFKMPENIQMSGDFAYRADQPMHGLSALGGGGYRPPDTSGTHDGIREEGEDLMRQMF